MPHRLLVALLGALALIAPATAVAAPANVKLRVEGVNETLLPRTALLTDNRVVNKSGVAGQDCTGTSAAGALEIGTAGNWGGSFFAGLGYSVERIFAESHVFPEPDFFELWRNNVSSATGLCGTELQEGDDVLFIVARCVADPVTFVCTNPPVLPLGLTAPATATVGTPFNVTVVEYAATGTLSPAAGATVTGGTAPATTNAAGVAAVTVAAGGTAGLRATLAGRVRSATEQVCATTGSDGLCGSPRPAVAAVTPPPPPCDTNGRDGRCQTRDLTASAANIVGIQEGRRYGRGQAPRKLDVRVDPDPSGLLRVKLRLTRSHRGRCFTFSGRSERFVRVPCGAARGFWFGIGDRQESSYLLPHALPVGRYVLDVNAIDKAYNRDDARRRGGNRVVFHVE